MSLGRILEMRGAIYHDMAAGDRRLHPKEAALYELVAEGIHHATLPDARTLRTGGIHLTVKNLRAFVFNIEIRDFDGNLIATIGVLETWILCLTKNDTSAGTWHVVKLS